MENDEPKTVVSVSADDLDSKTSGDDESEQSWSFLLPFAVPAFVVVLAIAGFVAFRGHGSNLDSNLDASGLESTGSGKVAGAATQSAQTQQPTVAGPAAPKVVSPIPSPSPATNTPPSPSPTPSPSPSPSPTPTPTPTPTPSPSQSPSPSPTPSP